jgi:hypothetical protein
MGNCEGYGVFGASFGVLVYLAVLPSCMKDFLTCLMVQTGNVNLPSSFTGGNRIHWDDQSMMDTVFPNFYS